MTSFQQASTVTHLNGALSGTGSFMSMCGSHILSETWTPTCILQVEGAPACSRFRLTISRVRNPVAACAVQLACVDLHYAPAGMQEVWYLHTHGICTCRLTVHNAGGIPSCCSGPMQVQGVTAAFSIPFPGSFSRHRSFDKTAARRRCGSGD